MAMTQLVGVVPFPCICGSKSLADGERVSTNGV